jgi:hypothetical protein
MSRHRSKRTDGWLILWGAVGILTLWAAIIVVLVTVTSD